MRFGSAKSRFVSPKMQFGSDKLRFGKDFSRFGSARKRSGKAKFHPKPAFHLISTGISAVIEFGRIILISIIAKFIPKPAQSLREAGYTVSSVRSELLCYADCLKNDPFWNR